MAELEKERLARFRLARAENVGPVTFRDLLAHCGSAIRALELLPQLARRGGRKKPITVPSTADAEREIAALKKFGAELLIFGDPNFPEMLATLDPPPPMVLVRGHRHLLDRPAIAIVGSRNASAAGIEITRRFAADLGTAGFVIVSGLARGIDAAAHRAALATGTCGVLAGGLDIVYPLENQKLYDQMQTEGLLLSEMPLGTRPQARHFPRRNRLISGLARGVIVIEAALRSGSLITARYAGEQGRDLFAVPGSPLDPRCQGANRLIKQGATLVESAADVLDELVDWQRRPLREPETPSWIGTAGDMPAEPDERDRSRVLQLLGPTPIALDEIIRQSGLSPATVSIIILELELAGRLSREPGTRISLIETMPTG